MNKIYKQNTISSQSFFFLLMSDGHTRAAYVKLHVTYRNCNKTTSYQTYVKLTSHIETVIKLRHTKHMWNSTSHIETVINLRHTKHMWNSTSHIETVIKLRHIKHMWNLTSHIETVIIYVIPTICETHVTYRNCNKTTSYQTYVKLHVTYRNCNKTTSYQTYDLAFNGAHCRI